MNTSNNTTVSTALATSATAVAIGCLIVSAFQAASFFGDNIPNPQHKFIMIAGPTMVLLGSQVIARLILRSKAPAWAMILMLISCLLAEGGSIFTSVVSFDGNLITARRDQNLTSPELDRANQTINMLDSQIKAAQDNRDKMPENWITRKERADAKIGSLIGQRQAAVAIASTIDVSTSGKAMDNVESKIGVSQTDIALLFAILLSCIPFSINLGLGSLQRTGSEGAQAAKKSQAQPLRSVA